MDNITLGSIVGVKGVPCIYKIVRVINGGSMYEVKRIKESVYSSDTLDLSSKSSYTRIVYKNDLYKARLFND